MIRVAILSDIDIILSIYTQMGIKTMVDDVVYGEYDFTEHIKSGNIYVCDDNGVVGFTVFYDHITWAYIEILCVDKNHRGFGVGKSLLESVKNEKWGVIELCCHDMDKDVIDFVEKCNFIKSNQITNWYYKNVNNDEEN